MTNEFKMTPGENPGNFKKRAGMCGDFLFTCLCKACWDTPLAGDHLLWDYEGDMLNIHFRFNRDGSFSQVVELIYIYIKQSFVATRSYDFCTCGISVCFLSSRIRKAKNVLTLQDPGKQASVALVKGKFYIKPSQNQGRIIMTSNDFCFLITNGSWIKTSGHPCPEHLLKSFIS